MNTVNYTKQLAKIHLDLSKHNIIDGLVDNSVEATLQKIIDTTNVSKDYLQATYSKEIMDKLTDKEENKIYVY